MNRCHFKMLIFLIATTMWQSYNMDCQAQNDTSRVDNSHQFHVTEVSIEDPWTSFWAINFHGGIGYSTFRDAAISPVTYHGGALSPGLDVHFIRNMTWHYILETKLNVGEYEDAIAPQWNFSTTAGSYSLRMFVLRQFSPTLKFSYWAGISLDNHLWMDYNTNLGNAAWGLTDFVGFTLHGNVNYTFTTRRNTNPWMVSAHFGITPMALIYRPGYVYVDNYSADNSGLWGATFSSYKWNAKGFAGVETTLSIKKYLKNRNTVGLSYHWDFFTSGTTGSQRFEESNHILTLDLGFCLRP